MSEFWQTLFVQLLNHIPGFDSDIWTNKWRVEPLPGLALPVVSVSIFPIIEAPPDSDYLSLLRYLSFSVSMADTCGFNNDGNNTLKQVRKKSACYSKCTAPKCNGDPKKFKMGTSWGPSFEWPNGDHGRDKWAVGTQNACFVKLSEST